MRALILAAFVIWVSYPVGVALVTRFLGKRSDPRVRPLDMFVVLLLAACEIFLLRSYATRTTLLWTIPLSIAVGFLLHAKRGGTDESGLAGEYSDQSRAHEPAASALKRAWKRWVAATEVIGNFQVRLLFAYIYLFFLFPWGIWYRFKIDPLQRRHGSSLWNKAESAAVDLDVAGRQF